MTAIEANKIIFNQIAEDYDKTGTHFYPENQRKVRNILENIVNNQDGVLLDLGCGTGFIINLAKDLFKEIHGVDISDKMLEQVKVDNTSANISLHNLNAASIPFENNYFDVITAYAFIHHLDDYLSVLKEAYRVLKKGGVLYTDLDPNREFVLFAEQYKDLNLNDYSNIAQREIKNTCYVDQKNSDEFSIDKEVFNISEYLRTEYGGIQAHEFKKEILKIGFSECEINYSWYPGQGKIINEQSLKDSEIINNYLQEILPLSSNMFKYISFIIKK